MAKAKAPRVVERKIADLKPADYNPRRLTDKQEADLRESLSRFDCIDPVIVNVNPERKDIIVGGHQRAKVWAALGHATIPTIEVNLTLEQERELNVRLNKNGGSWDWDALANHFEAIELIQFGFEEWEFGFSESQGEDFADAPEFPTGDTTATAVAPQTIRKMQAILTPEEYEWALERMKGLMQTTGAKNHTELYTLLLDRYEAKAVE